ncbi:MAG: energy-coupling factor transporter transmembrane protein EcfT [Propionibacteriaceae bacterium]|nr:energy-coupling factor transporter transmembrane protein EcfT [Propionibacteriaceae bacterium]
MLSLFTPGNSLIHRTPAWVKLLMLAILGTTAMLISSAIILGAGLALIALGYITARVPWRLVWRISRMVVLFVGLIAAVQWLFMSAHSGLVVGLRITILVTAANLLTLTTSMTDLISAVETWLKPLMRVGVRPDRVGIAIALTLRFIPVLIEQGRCIREAQAARGVKARFTYLVPLIIRTLRMADGVGEALEVRGVS